MRQEAVNLKKLNRRFPSRNGKVRLRRPSSQAGMTQEIDRLLKQEGAYDTQRPSQ